MYPIDWLATSVFPDLIFGGPDITASAIPKEALRKGPFDSQLMLIHVWVKQNAKWRLVAHQTTKLVDL